MERQRLVGLLKQGSPELMVSLRLGFQLSLVQQARREGLPVRELQPDRDKVSRAMPATAALEGGRVLLPQTATWTRGFIDEVLAFPVGRHDDQVDVLSYAVAAARTASTFSLALCSADDDHEDPDDPAWDFSENEFGNTRGWKARKQLTDSIWRAIRLN